MRKLVISSVICTLFAFHSLSLLVAAEGMYPLSEIKNLDLKSEGIDLNTKEIFNPDGVSLIDGIVKVGGCTGSFVSIDGLILTNHHCAYRAIQSASTLQNDYLENGFLARDWTEEIPAKGYTVRITDSYKDVSKEILGVVTDDMDFIERTKAIEKKKKEIISLTEKENPGKRAEISEMFIGKTYYLFIYTWLKDVRLVYAPPSSIGNFGGETDNWTWPRHTGDFSFMRVYVAPDGSPAEFALENVPYHPRKILKVNPEGVDEEDFVFIMGYPGRTYRHRTSYFLEYETNIRMPYVVQLYAWEVSVMEEMGKDERKIALAHSKRIKSLSNTLKNYRGKLLGIERLQLLEQKKKEEKELQAFIDEDEERKQKYGNLFNEIEILYQERSAAAERDLLLDYLIRGVYLLNYGYKIYESSLQREKEDMERLSAYMERNFNRTKENLILSLRDYHEPTDKVFLKEFLMRAAILSEQSRISAIDEVLNGKKTETAIDEFVQNLYAKSDLANEDELIAGFEKSTNELIAMNDPVISFIATIYPSYEKLREERRRQKGVLDKYHSQLVDVKKQFQKSEFIPDANSTLRLTYGRIRGYSPADAIYYDPITTLKGVIQKSTGIEPFNSPQKLFDLYLTRDFGRFENEKLNNVPVCILYNLDTTGGNSGSPVLNARGELVGLNFDRAFEATINDYAWNEKYSRSIGVDIRYVLWITQKFGGADYLLKEMKINTN
jgi:hypothetical protein